MNQTSTLCHHCEPSSLRNCPERDVLTSSSSFLISAESHVATTAFVCFFYLYQKMKAVSPVHPQDSSHHSFFSGAGEGSHPSAVHSLSKHSVNISRCRMEEEDLFCLQYDMNDCYTRLKRLVPTIPKDKKVSKVEILQHVIDYILDLQLALETHPSLQKTQACPPPHTANPNRTPLTVLNIDHHQRTSIVKKPEDSILCR